MDNPIGYKFSWSPIGAIRALKNNAKFLQDGEVVEVPNKDLLVNAKPVEINIALNLEGYYNRDSLSYKDLYQLNDCKTVIRGTLRFGGFCTIMSSFTRLGLLNEEKIDQSLAGKSYSQYLGHLV